MMNHIDTIRYKHRLYQINDDTDIDDDPHCPTWLRNQKLPKLPKLPNTQLEIKPSSPLNLTPAVPSVLPISPASSPSSGCFSEFQFSAKQSAEKNYKFDYQQCIIEFLNYLIGKFKELDGYIIENYSYWENTSMLVLINLTKINYGFKIMIHQMLKRLNNNNSRLTNHDSIFDFEKLIKFNIFQLVYNSNLINIGEIINNFLLLNEFKFNLLSYYFKLEFLLSKEQEIRLKRVNELVIPMDIWFKLPNFLKNLKDYVLLVDRSLVQDLEICLVKLSTVTNKFSQIDELKKYNSLANWCDLNKINQLINYKFPEICGGYNVVEFQDYNYKPLSTSKDVKIENTKSTRIPKSSSKLKIERAREVEKSKKDIEVARKGSIKRSLSKLVKRSKSTNDAKLTARKKEIPIRNQSLHQSQMSSSKSDSNLKIKPLPKPPVIKPTNKAKFDKTQIQHQITSLEQYFKKLTNLAPNLIYFLKLQSNYCKSRIYLVSTKYQKIVKEYYEKLVNQLEFTNNVIIIHINDKLLTPIKQCLRLIEKGKANYENVKKFMELISIEFNQLYTKWLEGIIGAESVKRFERLYKMMGGDNDSILYYNQLTKLKSLAL